MLFLTAITLLANAVLAVCGLGRAVRHASQVIAAANRCLESECAADVPLASFRKRERHPPADGVLA